ncbi:hypothetical protein J6590_036185 [Homalodisca vitripennis]|nr:hypothetical protein J6590_036185 [Homalodisca vitripennis]
MDLARKESYSLYENEPKGLVDKSGSQRKDKSRLRETDKPAGQGQWLANKWTPNVLPSQIQGEFPCFGHTVQYHSHNSAYISLV